MKSKSLNSGRETFSPLHPSAHPARRSALWLVEYHYTRRGDLLSPRPLCMFPFVTSLCSVTTVYLGGETFSPLAPLHSRHFVPLPSRPFGPLSFSLPSVSLSFPPPPFSPRGPSLRFSSFVSLSRFTLVCFPPPSSRFALFSSFLLSLCIICNRPRGLFLYSSGLQTRFRALSLFKWTYSRFPVYHGGFAKFRVRLGASPKGPILGLWYSTLG